MIEGEHFIERCSCGLVVRQCRCPSPMKSESVIDGPCYHSDEEKQRGRQDHPQPGWHWHGAGLGRIQHENHPDQNEGAHLHPDMEPGTPWFGNPEEMGLTDEPVASAGPSFTFGIPAGMFQAIQTQINAMNHVVEKADGLADAVTVLIGTLTSLYPEDMETFIGLQPVMWPVAGHIAAYWRARAGVTKGLQEDEPCDCQKSPNETMTKDDLDAMVDDIMGGGTTD